MKVVVASDAIAGLSAREASETIARAFADGGAAVAVIPLAVSGDELRAAVEVAADGVGFASPVDAVDAGEALASALGDLVLDLTATQVAAWGAATLQAFGDDPATALAAARERWAGRELVALVADGQQERPLTGMHGYAATEGREAGLPLAQVLEADREGERWLEALGLEQGPGSGAAGGLGLLIQAMGGRVVDPLTYLAERFSLENTITQADVVVTGAERLDFHAVGGPIVKRVVALAEAALRPAVAIVGRNYVSARELRLAGLETAYPLLPGAGEETSTPERLVEVAQQVATTWSW